MEKYDNTILKSYININGNTLTTKRFLHRLDSSIECTSHVSNRSSFKITLKYIIYFIFERISYNEYAHLE